MLLFCSMFKSRYKLRLCKNAGKLYINLPLVKLYICYKQIYCMASEEI